VRWRGVADYGICMGNIIFVVFYIKW
jgi:hypothetical protein